jgi:hypothetical protein
LTGIKKNMNIPGEDDQKKERENQNKETNLDNYMPVECVDSHIWAFF